MYPWLIANPMQTKIGRSLVVAKQVCTSNILVFLWKATQFYGGKEPFTSLKSSNEIMCSTIRLGILHNTMFLNLNLFGALLKKRD